MKKFIALVVIVIAVVCTYSVVELSLPSDNNADCSIFTRGNTTGKGIWLYGDTYMATCKGSEVTELMANAANVVAMQYSIKGGYDKLNELLKRNNVAVINTESVGDSYIIYGLSDMATGRSVVAGGKQVNIQIALKGNTITVGTPLIMGSY